MAETYKNKNKSWKDSLVEWRTGEVAWPGPRFVYRPSDEKGSFAFFRYANTKVCMSRVAGSTVTVGYDRKPLEMETLTLTVWGTSSDVLTDLLAEALDDAKEEQKDELNVWVLGDSWMGGWEKAISKKVRDSESVIMDGSISADIVADASQFQKSGSWYAERGIPYRRGYLLHGPPGTGKTSFCQVLAGSLSLDMCILNLADKELNDTTLASALRETPKEAIVMIEDIDAVFVERKKSGGGGGGGGGNGVTFSG